MTVTRLGSLSVGAALPGAAAAAAQLAILVGEEVAAAAELTAQVALAGSLDFPSPVEVAAAAVAIATDYDPIAAAAAALDISASFSADATAKAGLAAAGQAALDAITAPLAVAGLRAYVFDGQASALGDELGGAVADDLGSSTPTTGIFLATDNPAVFTALTALVKSTP